MLLLLYILIGWVIASVGVGVVIYFEHDQKFGTHNLLISALGMVFFFFSPILLPVSWIAELRQNK